MSNRDFSDSTQSNGAFSNGRQKQENRKYVRPADELDLKKIFSTLFRYKWWVVGITALFTLGSVWYALSIQPVYESNGSIIVTENRNQMMTAGGDLQNLLATSYGLGMGSTLANELQIFRSRSLSYEIANRLIEEDTMENGKRYPILWRAFPEDSTVIPRDSVATRVRENMNAERTDREANLIQIRFSSYSPEEAAKLVDIAIDTYSNLSTQQNRRAAGSALSFLEQERGQIESRLQQTEEALRNYMNESRLVQVDEQTAEAIRRIGALEAQRQELQVKKVAVSSALEAYESQLNQIKPGLAGQFAESAGPMMERFQYRLAELETEKLLLLQRNPSLRDAQETEPYLVELNDQISLLRSEINRLATDLIGDDPEEYLGFLTSDDGGIASRLTDLRSKLVELRIEEAQFNAQELVLAERLAEESRFIDELPDNMIELARLRRDAEINEQLYLTISRQYAETALWEQTQFGLGRPLDYGTVPKTPTEPKKRLIVMIGFILGGILSVGLVFFRDYLNQTIDGAEKVKDLGYPLLAVIPNTEGHIDNKYNGKKKTTAGGKSVSTSWVSLLDSISPISESYRRLHNNIIYSHPDESFQVMLITSSNQGEGKTTVTSNLAVTLAESGKKVLVLDADLRRPAIHSFMGERNSPGLMEILFDDLTLEQGIKQTLDPNVDVITAGRRPPNPSAVLHSRKFEDLFSRLREKYDHILVDSAPYGIITDSAPIMRMADGVILVVRFGVAESGQLDQTIENLKRIRAGILGTVLTGYDHEQSSDYYYTSNTYYNSYKSYEQYQDK